MEERQGSTGSMQQPFQDVQGEFRGTVGLVVRPLVGGPVWTTVPNPFVTHVGTVDKPVTFHRSSPPAYSTLAYLA